MGTYIEHVEIQGDLWVRDLKAALDSIEYSPDIGDFHLGEPEGPNFQRVLSIPTGECGISCTEMLVDLLDHCCTELRVDLLVSWPEGETQALRLHRNGRVTEHRLIQTLDPTESKVWREV